MSVHRLNGLSICTLPKSVFVVHVLKAQKVSNYIPDHSEVFSWVNTLTWKALIPYLDRVFKIWFPESHVIDYSLVTSKMRSFTGCRLDFYVIIIVLLINVLIAQIVTLAPDYWKTTLYLLAGYLVNYFSFL